MLEPITIIPSESTTILPRVNVPSAADFVNGTFHLTFVGQPGRTYRLQASPDLVNWTTLPTTTSPTGVIDFLDTDAASLAQRFFRIVSP